MYQYGSRYILIRDRCSLFSSTGRVSHQPINLVSKGCLLGSMCPNSLTHPLQGSEWVGGREKGEGGEEGGLGEGRGGREGRERYSS